MWNSPGLRSSSSASPCCSTMAGSDCARISSPAPSSESTRRPKRPSKSRTVLPMEKGYLTQWSISEPAGPFGRNHPGIHPHPVEPAKEARVLDLDAPVHDRIEARGARLGERGLIPHAELLPEHFRANGDGVLGHRHDVRGLAEHVDQVYPVRDFPKRGVALLAEDLAVLRVHRDDAVAVLLHVLGGEIARPVPVGREAHHGDGAAFLEDAAQRVDVVHWPNTIMQSSSGRDMKSDLKTRHGGRILADALVAQGASMAFGVPGESYLPVLDGLHDVRGRFSFIVCRQEGGASYMAEAYGKLTGEPGILFVTRGPGASNGAIGVHTALQDSTPMVVFIGQVPNEFAEREAFQEIDYRRMYGQMAKWVGQIDRVERIPEYVSRAFHTACAGRPGPVVLALPEDTLFSEAAVDDVERYHKVRPAPFPESIAELKQ